jgi:hypothetical protein
MNKHEFLKSCEKLAINAPSSRGEPFPPFNEYAINEENFDDGLRFKSIMVDKSRGMLKITCIVIDWDETSPVDSLVNELIRYYTALARKYSLEEDVDIEINVSSKYSTTVEPTVTITKIIPKIK